MNSNMLGPLLLGCFLVLVLFVVHRIMARRGRRLAVVAALFGGEHKKGFLGDYYLCSYNGKPFRLEIWEGTRNHPQSLRVILLSPVAFNLLARTASFSDTMMEKLGARDDIRVGDGLFDERYLISASNPTAAQELFLAPEVRAAAASLMMLPGFVSGAIQQKVGYFYFFLTVCVCTIPSFLTIPFILKTKGLDEDPA